MTNTNVYRRVTILAVVVLAGGALSSCSTTTTTEAMIPEQLVSPEKPRTSAVSLVVGGESGGINIENFKQAITDAIVASGVFSGVDNGSGVPYLLDVRITDVKSPFFGAGMTVTVAATWKLFRTDDRTAIMEESIDATYAGGAFEGGMVGVNRVRVATEGAARRNIGAGIGKLAALDLPAD